ncbi:Pr6Pr family membrane protein [Herbiconiux sp. CPCC 205763]|uniref:Pr6Pr family membrane protein n=1 Tax=Herbiconiux aconitum TaxID=2970913 RepID=A0ABT2GT30_9MICO|nr:Pr6Pr family membrane protein [Herbiconiux aconitum]MCS5718006.1 Pr6Pr family membrane protein [Herbiconiux aconitum]
MAADRTPSEPSPKTPDVGRRIAGVVRLIVGVGLAVTIGIQIGDRVANNAFDPWEYFSYFTIETSLFNIVVLLVGGVLALRFARDPQLFTTVRMATLTYAIITAAVYNLLLRNIPPTGYPGLDWPNEVVHVWVPLLLLLDWLLAPGRPSLPWRSLWIVPIYPVAWAVYTFLRAAASGGAIYPYPFLDPATDGWLSVFVYIVALTGVLVGLGALAVAYTRIRSRRLEGLPARRVA